MKLKKLFKFALQNYFITIFFACILFVGFVSLYKLFISEPHYIYTKVKLGQGLWWANTNKPSFWMVNSIKKGDSEKSLTGQEIIKVLSVRYYPWNNPYQPNQYDTYLTLKLTVNSRKKTGQYNFKRSTIGVGSPIELELSSAQVSGTIIELSESPIKDSYEEKIITLVKSNAFSWEYDAIKKGEKYFDGETDVFEILDKKSSTVSLVSLATSTKGRDSSLVKEKLKNIFVTAKIKVKKLGNQLIFGEEQIVQVGKPIIISTPSYTFTNYLISTIE